ncbi:MAG: hypothetical protein P4L50_18180 [Anaerolineaceae bacterium]|nr:hypothetical protein [Anaerolineaceae bacterium]
MTAYLPSVFRIIRRDYLAITLAWVPVTMWLLYGVVYLLPALLDHQPVSANGFLILILVGLTLYSWLALAWRITNIRAVFSAGIHVQGIITGLWFFRNRGQMCFSYKYQGIIHDAKMTLVKGPQTRTLKEGASLDLLVDPDNSERTFLQDLFI